ncbi:hypothetical protein [Dankookia sp. P2]|uniref:hypothetical protein n=1 Tax=Dankookia sp. P2 TaxID=3423955 RepID=UPI003D66522E
MNFTRSLFLTGLLMLAAGGSALAQVSGPYIGAGAGANFRQDSDLTLKGHGADMARAMRIGTTGTLSFDSPGPVAFGSLGWGFGQGIRTEVEFSYRSAGVGAVSVAGYPAHPQLHRHDQHLGGDGQPVV